MLNGKPLCIELFCGMFGWSAGWLKLGGMAVGFDIDHQPYHGPVPEGASLVLQDVLTLDGARFKDADLILCSPPCQEFSYMAMPWSRAKQIQRALHGIGEFPKGYTGSRTVKELTALFDACFRIQREAIEAAGHFIPLVVENVRGAQKWVGRVRWHCGSFYLWGDVPALMPIPKRGGTKGSVGTINGSGKIREQSAWDHVKLPGFRFDGSGRSLQTASVEGTKQGGEWWHDPKSITRTTWGGSTARKAASAQIAKIPFALASWIAKCYWPKEQTEALEFTC
jgi:hypothetical protein